jgi:hypothetical protein
MELLWQSVLFLGIACALAGGFRWMLAKHNGNVRQTLKGCAKVFLGIVLIILALLGVTVIGVVYAAPDIWAGRKPVPPATAKVLLLGLIACAGMLICGVYQLFRATFGQPRDAKVSLDDPQATDATLERPEGVPQPQWPDLRDAKVIGATVLLMSVLFVLFVAIQPTPPKKPLPPPIIRPISQQTIWVGKPLSILVSVENAQLWKDRLRYSLGPNAPVGSVIDAKTGVFTWTPTETQGPGKHDVVVLANGPEGETAQTTFEVNVTPPLKKLVPADK